MSNSPLILLFMVLFTESAYIVGISTLKTLPNENGKSGSYLGGTSLYLHADFKNGDPSLYSVLIGGLSCNLILFDSDESTHHCITPASKSYFPSKVSIQILSQSDDSLKVSSSVELYFSYSYERTPWILYMNPTEACPGDEVAFVGRWGTSDWRKITEAKISNKQLTLMSELDTLDYWGWLNVTTVINDNVHGDTGASIHLDEGFGLSDTLWIGTQYNSIGAVYNFRTLAKIDSINYNEGSKEGGVIIEILGAGFPTDEELLEVVVDGAICDVSSASYTKIECFTSEKSSPSLPDSQVFIGGAGLYRESWVSSLPFSSLVELVSPNMVSVIATPQLNHNDPSDTRTRLTGLFLASVTGSYKFHTSADAAVQIFLSTDSSSTNKIKILDSTYKADLQEFFTDPTSMSSSVSLIAGQSYFIEILHSANGGANHLDVGLEMPGNGPNKLPFVQKVTILPKNLVREVQKIKIGGAEVPTGGVLVISYGMKSAKGVNWDLESKSWKCSDIVSSLNKLSLGDFLCSFTRDDTNFYYNITFNYPRLFARSILTVDATQILPSGRTIIVTKTTGTTALKGTFTISFNGQVSNPISLSSWYRTVERDLNIQISSLNAKLILKGSLDGDGVRLNFILPGDLIAASASQFTIDYSLISGGALEGALNPTEIIAISLVIQSPKANTVFYSVIPSDFLRTAENSPQLILEINGSRAVCRGNCNFVYKSPPEYPLITSSSDNGANLTIVGTSFDTEPLNLYVFISYSNCEITSVTETEIVCKLPLGPSEPAMAGSHKPIVMHSDKGYITSIDTHKVIIPLVITSVDPTTGSIEGGTTLTITGSGFAYTVENPLLSQTVMIGSSPCKIQSTTTTEIICVTSVRTDTDVITITVGEVKETSNDFTYDSSISGLITEISPTKGSPIYSTQVQITGSNFPNDPSQVIVQLVSSTLDAIDCLVSASTESSIDCEINGGRSGTYKLEVKTESGFASFESGVSSNFEIVFDITSVSPITGSVNGGTLITILGVGFSNQAKSMGVYIGTDENPCEIQTATSDSITCITSSLKTKTIGTEYSIILSGRFSNIATCSGGCKFSWTSAATPIITLLTPNTAQSGDSIVITASNFGTTDTLIHVYFGSVEAYIESISPTSVTVTVPASKGVSIYVSLSVEGMGKATGSLVFKNAVLVTNIVPNEISKGGADLQISGSGFDSGMVFTFGGVACKLTDVADDYAKCRAAAYTTNELPKRLDITGTGSYACEFISVCAITYKASQTPTLTGKTGDLTLTGAFPIVDISEITVYLTNTVGTYLCKATDITETSLKCIPDAPAGIYTISVAFKDRGFAIGTISSYSLVLSVATASAPDSSYAGGSLLELEGKGLHKTTIVKVCGFLCPIVAATGNQLTCHLPALPTKYSQSSFHIQSHPTLLSTFEITSSASSSTNLYKLYDQNIETYFSDSANKDVFVIYDVGADWTFELSKIRFIGGGTDHANYTLLVGTLLQGSNDKTTWTDIKKFVSINNFWNNWGVKSGEKVSFRYYRLYKSKAASGFALNEIEFYGIRILDQDSMDATCPITVATTSSSTPVTPATLINYNSASTALVTQISPNIGSSKGGTLLTFIGIGFSDVAESISIKIDDIECGIQSATSSEITCETGARTTSVTHSLILNIIGQGLAVLGSQDFIYTDSWSDISTWADEVPPKKGEFVTIPLGSAVILDVPTPLLAAIVIEGTLIVEDIEGITIDAYYIYVDGGKLQIGTEENPFINDITITIHGNRNSPELPYYGNKFIAVRNGVLDIHGSPMTPSWSLLQETAMPGDAFIKLTDEVNWKKGQQIVIATSSYLLEESEVMKIESVSENIVNLAEPLMYMHYGAIENYESDTIDMRAEVGLLNRNIKIQGSDEGLDTMHGVHIMLFAPGGETCIGRIENLELLNAGQAYSLGRYPINFHMVGPATQSYIRNNAIHNTFNRVTAVHGVSYLTIENNVAFYTMGHTYFTQDGIESQNTLKNNLGISTLKSHSLMNTDQTPAVFWITNPNNYVLNNRAAGSESYGYMYSLSSHPSGPAAISASWPEFTELGEFSNNFAHSIGKHGFGVFDSYFPSTTPGEPIADYTKPDWWNVPNAPIPAIFTGLTAWKCLSNGAIIKNVGDVRLIDFKVSDNVVAGIETTYTHTTQWYQTTRVQNALIIGNSLNTEDKCDGSVGLLTSQTDGLLVDGAKFSMFSDTQYPLGDESQSFKPETRDTGARITKLKGLSFTNTHRKILWGMPMTGVYEILDDSLNNINPVFATAYWDHLLTPECTDERDGYNSIICTDVKIRRVTFYGLSPFESFNSVNISVARVSGDGIQVNSIENPDGTVYDEQLWTSISMQSAGKLHELVEAWSVPLVTGYKYRMHWGQMPVDWSALKIEQDTFDGDEWVHLQLNFTDHRDNFTASRGTLPAGVKTSDPGFVDPRRLLFKASDILPTDPSGTYTWNNISNPKLFEMIINGVPGNVNQWGDITVSPYKCFGPNCQIVIDDDSFSNVTTVYYWSDPSTWAGGVLPRAGTVITIPRSWHLYLDIDTPVFQEIQVKGILEFSPNKSVSLNTHWLFIRGGSLISGSLTNPLNSSFVHEIILHGKSTEDSFAFNPEIQAGNKVIVVTGAMNLYGYPKIETSALEQNVYPGDNVIFVTGVDWQVGDSIAISPSGYDPNEYEVFNITAIKGVVANYEQILNGTIPPVEDFSTDPNWISSNAYRQYGKDKSTADPNQQASPALTTGITKLTLNSAIKYYHSGAPLSINGYIVDMRTEVALISRNIRVRSEGGWQFTSVVNDWVDENVYGTPIHRTGSVDLHHVWFSGCAQFETNLACLRFENSGTKPSAVASSTFTDPATWAISLMNAQNVEIYNSFILNARWQGVVATNVQNITMKNNIIIRVRQKGISSANTDTSAGFHFCSSKESPCTFQMVNNKVLGYDFAGFIMSGGECGNSKKVANGNKARSGLLGFILTNNGAFTCMESTSNIAHFSNTGISFKTSAYNMKLSKLEFVENSLGISMGVERPNQDLVTHDLQLSDSYFIGKTIHSYCNNCSSSECAARVGYMFAFSESNNQSITLLSKLTLPLNQPRHEANVLGSTTIKNIQFMYYNPNPTCGVTDYAIKTNNWAADYNLPQYFSQILFANVSNNSLIYMHDPNPAWLNPHECASWNCTGPLNALGIDLDGSLVNSTGGFILPNNPGIAKNNTCVFRPKMNAYFCRKNITDPNAYLMLIFESMDSDNTTRIFSPINITTPKSYPLTTISGLYRNDIASFKDHSWDGVYTGHIRWSRFPSVIWSGQHYNVTSTGILPNSLEFRLQMTQNKNLPVIISMRYKEPAAIQVFINGTLVQAIKWGAGGFIEDCRFNDTHGTNRWFHDQNMIQFVLRSEVPVLIKKVSSVSINIEIDMPIKEFFSNNGGNVFIDKFAALIQVPGHRVRIMNVKAGSTVLYMEITEDSGLNKNYGAGSNAAQMYDLKGIEKKIKEMYTTKQLEKSLGVSLLNFATSINEVSSSSVSTSGSSGNSGNNGASIEYNDTNPNSGGIGLNPTGENFNETNKRNNNTRFQLVMRDWGVAIIAGIIISILILSALYLPKENLDRSIGNQNNSNRGASSNRNSVHEKQHCNSNREQQEDNEPVEEESKEEIHRLTVNDDEKIIADNTAIAE